MNLKDTYVIFITGNDVLAGNQPVYHIERSILEKEKKNFEDGSHIIYVNGAWSGEDPIGHLVHDFRCEDPDTMFYSELAERSRILKGTERGEEVMSWWGDELRAEGRTEAKRETVQNMHALGMEDSVIAKAVGVAVEQVRQWLETVPVK